MHSNLDHLSSIRAKILDLSMRNPFINYKLNENGNGRSVNIIGNINQIAQSVSTGKPLALNSTKDGMSLDKDSNEIIVNLAGKSKSFLLNMSRSQKSLISETGVNSLYMAMGFVAWQETEGSDFHHAPICLVPAIIERTSDEKYSLALDVESIEINNSFIEKIQQSFGIQISIESDMAKPISVIREMAQKIAGTGKKWKIVEACAIGFFDFAKIYLYNDIDPLKIIKHDLINHDVIKSLCGDNQNTLPPKPIEIAECKIENESSLRLIYDADSSQHHVINRVLAGESLIVEGPPGTGKSQTITNMVAALMQTGKRVLFVAEKKAALDVVKGRLEKAGLADFCLDIHQRITTNSLSADLEKRVSLKNDKKLNSFKLIEKELASQRSFLNGYVEAMTEIYPPAGISIFDAITGAARWRLESNVPLSPARLGNVATHDIGEILLLSEGLQNKCNEVQEVSSGSAFHENPWLLVDDKKSSNGIALINDIGRIISSLEDCASKITSSTSSINIRNVNLQENIGFAIGSDLDIKGFFESRLADYSVINNAKKISEDIISSGRDLAGIINTEECSLGLQEFSRDVNSLRVFFCDKKSIQEILELTSKVSKLNKEDLLQKTLEAMSKNTRIVSTSIFGEILSISSIMPESSASRLCFVHSLVQKKQIWEFIENSKRINEEKSLIKNSLEMLGVRGFESMEISQAEYLLSELNNTSVFSIFSKKRNAAIDKIRSIFLSNPNFEKMKIGMELVLKYLNKNEQINLEMDGLELARRFKNREEKRKAVFFAFKLSTFYTSSASAALVNFDENEAANLYDLIAVAQRDFSENGLINDLKSSINDFDIYNGAAILVLFKKISEHENKVKSIISFLTNKEIPLLSLSSYLNTIDNYIHQFDRLNAIVRDFPRSFGIDETKSLSLVYSEIYPKLKEVDNISKIDSIVINFNGICERLGYSKTAINNELRSISENFASACAAFSESREMHEEFSRMYLSENLSSLEIDSLKKTLQFYKSLRESRHTSSAIAIIRNIIHKLNLLGLSSVIREVMGGRVPVADIKAFVMHSFYNHWAESILEDRPHLSRFLNENKESIRLKFADNDRKFIEHNRTEAFLELHRRKIDGKAPRNKRVSDLSGDELVNYVINKPTCRVKIRDLLARSSKSIQKIKPCFMMSPLTVAKYLPLGEISFDVVIIDEASQVRPEDALSSLIRGAQYVIVGDSKQLEPTDFFSTKDEDDEDESETLISSSKSVLDAFKVIATSVQLNWHYRSKHQSLISFSNNMYYGGSLTVFPSPKENGVDNGITFNHVSDGYYHNMANTNEALKVVDHTIKIISENPLVSIGIVAMNSNQSKLIQDMFDRKAQYCAQTRRVLQENADAPEPLFIKNLESVQGDERDSIVISFTYGKVENTNIVHQRFNQFNTDSGWKRLNVLLTRARQSLTVFSSILGSDIGYRKDGSLSRGVGDLKAFLDFAETGKMPVTINSIGGEVDNDFERSIKDYIEKHGYICDAQVGASGYFIDLAVKHPKIKGKYLLAVECDGATYHGSRSARDRDRLRQSVLESMGWEVMRVWSTDWFNDPDRAIKPIIDRLGILSSAN